MRDWWLGTAPGEWVSMAVASDGSYGVPHGLVYSFPVTIEKKEWSVVKGLKLSGFAEEKMRSAAEELISEIIDAESDGHTLLARL
ncbi:PREDICTED: malate dehydrogenase-like [Priapulus caudatus]|uniref:Malate dehydrogenase-like n=1 Tax=Priapulus caudatus TaxID=37621 RepID=A0ABM1EIT4_PRICU|nr:PREDICTED: malate dehydrogenase-like [Priapulus caudatus]